ncbi:peptide chain release factor N(5)-glutamine methyltransferase [Mesomycoplasma moatsii]|uniref:peptide chain release factor N(5)-glutamine methyltransferase n=1 Tax=Mesomycoplasma moatsii TaxID=171287 RepID=UPI0003B700D9
MKQKISNLKLEKRRYDLKEKVSLVEKFQLWRNKPIQKIIGYIIMADVKIDLSKKVLIPRYETEELIYQTIDFIEENQYKEILDLCCGSGFIGIALKKFFNEINVCQSDIDKNAIKQTIINLKLNNIQNDVIQSNMFENINKKFDLIVSNPPYLSEKEISLISKSVLKFEPHKALFAKNNGLEFYEIIEKNLNKYLKKNGMIILEINPDNEKWFLNNGYNLIKDINGKKRIAFKKKDWIS